jgi:hypothetical protein
VEEGETPAPDLLRMAAAVVVVHLNKFLFSFQALVRQDQMSAIQLERVEPL